MVKGHTWVYSKFKTNLEYVPLCTLVHMQNLEGDVRCHALSLSTLFS